MAYFEDLEPCYYHSGLLDADAWRCRLLAVGWVEAGRDFVSEKAAIPPSLLDRITFLRSAMHTQYSSKSFRGFHECSLCGEMLVDSHVNLIIPGDECVFAVPGRIDHYIQKHDYRPPKAFGDAVTACPDPREHSYLAALLQANGGAETPLHDV